MSLIFFPCLFPHLLPSQHTHTLTLTLSLLSNFKDDVSERKQAINVLSSFFAIQLLRHFLLPFLTSLHLPSLSQRRAPPRHIPSCPLLTISRSSFDSSLRRLTYSEWTTSHLHNLLPFSLRPSFALPTQSQDTCEGLMLSMPRIMWKSRRQRKRNE